MGNKERFISLCKRINRKGVEDLMGWLEQSDFYTSPASTRFHGAYKGGLLEHSLNVYDELKRLISAYPELEVSEESIIIVSLFHDLCKVNTYSTEKRNRKNKDTGLWECYDAYISTPKLNYAGHGSKSVFLIQNFIKLSTEEAVAINAHMSCWNGDTTVGSAYEQFPLAWLTHIADESATFIKESNRKD